MIKKIKKNFGLIVYSAIFISIPVTMIILILITMISPYEHYEKELTFVNKKQDSPYKLYFESEEDGTYYYVNVSGWQLDNFKEKKGDSNLYNFKKKKAESVIKVRQIEILGSYSEIIETKKYSKGEK